MRDILTETPESRMAVVNGELVIHIGGRQWQAYSYDEVIASLSKGKHKNRQVSESKAVNRRFSRHVRLAYLAHEADGVWPMGVQANMKETAEKLRDKFNLVREDILPKDILDKYEEIIKVYLDKEAEGK